MRNSSLNLFQKQRLQRITLFIGRSHSWASDADVQGNTIAEGTDASPPTPNDDVASEFYNYDDMLGAKINCFNRCITLYTKKKLDNRNNL